MFPKSARMGSTVTYLLPLELPPTLWLVPYILAYIAIIGPANYLILRRKDRKELAWITIPVTIPVFTAGSLAYAYSKKGWDILISRINIVVHFQNTGIAKFHSAFGVFSPAKKDYNVSLPSGSSIFETNNFGPMQSSSRSKQALIIEDGPKPRLLGANIDMWSMRNFQYVKFDKSTSELSGTITIDRDGYGIQVSNSSNIEFTDAVAIAGSSILHIGKLLPHKDYSAKHDIKTLLQIKQIGGSLGHRIYGLQPGPVADREIQAKAETIDHYFGFNGEILPSGPVLVAWSNKPLEPIKIANENPKTIERTVIIVPLKFDLKDNAVIRPGMMSKKLVHSSSHIAMNSLDYSSFLLNNGSAAFEFSIPAWEWSSANSFTAGKLIMYFSASSPKTDNSVGDYNIAIYNWNNGAWHNLGTVKGTATVEQPSNFVSKEGKIRVQISASSNEIHISEFDFEVTGKWQ